MEKELPQIVKNNIKFLRSKHVWFITNTNVRVVSCSDAAANRKRLGHTGIPVFDELKTELGYFINTDKQRQKVLIHCRGNQKIDRLKVSSVLGAEYQRLVTEDHRKGLINPFNEEYRDLLQIFDSSTIKRIFPPYTMMTNAGDFEYAFEFRVQDLVNGLEHVQVRDIIRKDNCINFVKNKIGILTGNGPDSGMLLWKKINKAVKDEFLKRSGYAFNGDLSYPEIIIESIPEMGVSIEFKERLDIIEEVVTKSIINLCKNGATIICVGSNIIQYFSTRIKKICSLFNAEFVEIADVLKNSFVTKEINKFDFIGISHAADLNEYNSFSFLEKDFDVAFPDVQTLKIIREISINAKKNTESNKVAQPLGNILKQKTKNETIVVALTEISTVLDHHKKLVKSKTVIDTLQLMADYVAKKYVDGIYTTLFVDEYKDYISYQKLHKPIPESIKKQLWKILLEIDYEFVPPLSFRDSTTFSFDSDLKNTKVPEVYYQNLLKQELMVSMRKNTDEVVGFVSYIPNYTITHDNHSFKCFYITTIGVTKGARGNGIAKQFYKKIEEEAKKKATCTKVATRTWSMDKTHIRILESMGYKKVIEIENDRGLGIHTVYYAKDLNNIH